MIFNDWGRHVWLFVHGDPDLFLDFEVISIHRRRGSGARIGAGALLLSLSLALSACGRKEEAKPTVEVIHSWTSGGEAAAIHEIVRAFQARGGVWHETAVTGVHAGRALAISRIVGGQPPTAIQWTISRAVHDFARQGLLVSLDERAARDRWEKRYSPYIYRNMKSDRHIVMVPLALHGGNWMFVSTKALAAVGAHPPTTWDEFFAVAARLRAKGIVPLAFSGEAWTQALVFQNVMLGEGGKAFYRQVMEQHDVAAVRSPTMHRVFSVFGRLRQEVDNGVATRTWNAATGMLIAGKAAFQIGGDWTKGEFRAAGVKPGGGYDCLPSPGTAGSYIIYGDAFVFPVGRGDRGQRARELFLDTISDPAVIQRFSERKGAIPARLDVAPLDPDACTKQAVQTLRDVDAPMPNGALAFDPDTEGEIRDIITQYWVRSLSEDAAIEAMAKVIGNATK